MTISTKTFAALAACSMLTFAACGGAETKPAETTTKPAATNAAPATPATPAATPTSTTTAGGVTATTGAVPADFPKDVPIYKGASVVSAASTPMGYGAVLSSTDAPDVVGTFYKDELKKAGWADIQDINAAGTHTLTGTKDKQRVSVATTKAADGKTNISIGITKM